MLTTRPPKPSTRSRMALYPVPSYSWQHTVTTTAYNNNILQLQLGSHPVAVVVLHVHEYGKKVTWKFKSGGLREKHVIATWKLGNHLSIRLQTQGNEEKPENQENPVRVSINTKFPKIYFCIQAHLFIDFWNSFLCSVNVDCAFMTLTAVVRTNSAVREMKHCRTIYFITTLYPFLSAALYSRSSRGLRFFHLLKNYLGQRH